jgi:hypothetical protein
MKRVQVPPMLLTPVQYAVVDFLNTVFGDTKEAKKYWKEVRQPEQMYHLAVALSSEL